MTCKCLNNVNLLIASNTMTHSSSAICTQSSSFVNIDTCKIIYITCKEIPIQIQIFYAKYACCLLQLFFTRTHNYLLPYFIRTKHMPPLPQRYISYLSNQSKLLKRSIRSITVSSLVLYKIAIKSNQIQHPSSPIKNHNP